MSICPQRILNEAIDLIENLVPMDISDAEAERVENNLVELRDLVRRLPNKV